MQMVNSTAPNLIIVMGVSGSGKSSVAAFLANTLSYCFVEADDFHLDEAKKQMSEGIKLSAKQRQEWINRLCDYLQDKSTKGESVVIAYSGLKAAHRQQFRMLQFKTKFIFLDGMYDVISNRIEQRQGHFVSASFLSSQISDMEYPRDAETDITHINIEAPFDRICESALSIVQASFLASTIE